MQKHKRRITTINEFYETHAPILLVEPELRNLEKFRYGILKVAIATYLSRASNSFYETFYMSKIIAEYRSVAENLLFGYMMRIRFGQKISDKEPMRDCSLAKARHCSSRDYKRSRYDHKKGKPKLPKGTNINNNNNNGKTKTEAKPPEDPYDRLEREMYARYGY